MWRKKQTLQINSRVFKLSIIVLIGLFVLPHVIIESGLADNRIVEPLSIDKNNNRISDQLDKKIEENECQTSFRDPDQIDLIVNLDHFPTHQDISIVESFGGTVYQTWDELIFAMQVTLPKNNINSYVQQHEEVVLLQENALVNTSLEYSTRQIQARPTVWENTNNVYPQGYTGNPDHSIAIIDTGIDDTHPDIADQIIAWKDFIGEYNDGSTADIYLTPTDRHGHGTHCAGIALGEGSAGGILSEPGKMNISFSDYFLPIEGWGWYDYFPVDTTGGAENIDATLYWEVEIEGDEYYIWIVDENGIDVINEFGGSIEPLIGSSNDLVPMGIKNNYRVSFGTVDNEASGDVDTNGTNYCGQVRTPMNDLGDGYNLLSGVAPTCSLVGVKGLSDFGYGEDSDIINSMDWVYQNRELYDIRVVSMSLGGAAGEINPSEITVVNNLVGHGVVVVSSAGNNQGDDPPYVSSPALANKSIAVGAVNQYNEITRYSSIGDPGNSYIKPDVVAPGGSYMSHDLIAAPDSNDADHIYKTDFEQFFLSEQFMDDYQVMQGTSMACPHVAGVVGLMADAFGTWDYSSDEYSLLTKMILCMTACETNMPGEDAVSPTLDRGGKDRVEGYGIVCADAAIEAITCEHQISSIETETLGDTPIDKKVWARQIPLSTEEDLYYFELQVPDDADYDLYVYSKDYETFGDPIILSRSTTDAHGGIERIVYTPSYDGLHYLVVKWVDGSGEFTLTSDTQLPSEDMASVPVFSPVGVLLMMTMISFVGFLQIRRKK